MVARTMRAAVLAEPGRIAVSEPPLPQPGPGEVRLRLEGCGVCASNLEPWAGLPWLTYPGEAGGLGHEGWGRIDALGNDVRDLQVGDRVAALSYRSFAEYDLARADMVAVLPAALDGQPFPGEPLGCAFNIFRRSDIRAGQTVAIIERVKTLTGDGMCDRVIEAVGKQWPLDLATALIGFGGRLIVAGYHQDGPRQVNMQDWNWKGIDVVNAHERDPAVQMRGLREAIDAVASGRFDPTPLYTHRYPLERLDAALDATRDKPAGFVKALIDLA